MSHHYLYTTHTHVHNSPHYGRSSRTSSTVCSLIPGCGHDGGARISAEGRQTDRQQVDSREQAIHASFGLAALSVLVVLPSSAWRSSVCFFSTYKVQTVAREQSL